MRGEEAKQQRIRACVKMRVFGKRLTREILNLAAISNQLTHQQSREKKWQEQTKITESTKLQNNT